MRVYMFRIELEKLCGIYLAMKSSTFELMVNVVLSILHRYSIILSYMQPGLTLSFLPVSQRRHLRDPLTICIANMKPLYLRRVMKMKP
jgi:hypothetical protein